MSHGLFVMLLEKHLRIQARFHIVPSVAEDFCEGRVDKPVASILQDDNGVRTHFHQLPVSLLTLAQGIHGFPALGDIFPGGQDAIDVAIFISQYRIVPCDKSLFAARGHDRILKVFNRLDVSRKELYENRLGVLFQSLRQAGIEPVFADEFISVVA